MGRDFLIPHGCLELIQFLQPWRANSGLYQFGVPRKAIVETVENLFHEHLGECHPASWLLTEDDRLAVEGEGSPDSVCANSLISGYRNLQSARRLLCSNLGNLNSWIIQVLECHCNDILYRIDRYGAEERLDLLSCAFSNLQDTYNLLLAHNSTSTGH